MQASTSSKLNPKAAEFVPQSWSNPASKLPNETNGDPILNTRQVTIVAPQAISYKAVLQTTNSSSAQVVPLLKNSNDSYSSTLSDSSRSVPKMNFQDLLRSRRIRAPNKATVDQHKNRWIEIARSQSASLHSTENRTDRSVESCVSSIEPYTGWHRVLASKVAAENGEHNKPATTEALLLAERTHAHRSRAPVDQSIPFKINARGDYLTWWRAVLQADYASMAELIDQQRVSWDCTYCTELCDDADLQRGMDALCGSGAETSSANEATINAEGLHAVQVCSLRPSHALCLEQLLQRDTVCAHVDSHERTYKRTALHYAALAGNVEGIKILTSYEADVNLKDRAGNTALHFATRANNLAIISLLCEKSRKVVNVRNKNSETALMLAESRGAVQILINAGADLISRNAEGLDVITLAARQGNVALLDALLSSNCSHKTNRAPANVHHGSSTTPKEAPNQTTPLHQVAQNGNLACLKLLLSRCCSCSSVTG